MWLKNRSLSTLFHCFPLWTQSLKNVIFDRFLQFAAHRCLQCDLELKCVFWKKIVSKKEFPITFTSVCSHSLGFREIWTYGPAVIVVNGQINFDRLDAAVKMEVIAWRINSQKPIDCTSFNIDSKKYFYDWKLVVISINKREERVALKY